MEYHTEGFIKEITVKDDATITFTLAPTEAFAFGKDESDGKKMILIKGEPKQEESPEAKLVAQSVEFKICKGNSGGHETGNDEHGKKEPDGKDVLVNLLYALKKDRAQVRVSVEVESNPTASSVSGSENSQTYPIASITIL